MEETGKVIEVSGEFAVVELTAKDMCASCGAKRYCHPQGNKRHITALKEIDVKPGDMVRLDIQPGVPVLISFVLFLAPIVAFFLGYSIVYLIAHIQKYAIIAGFGALVVYLSFLRKLDEKLSQSSRFKPVIREKL